MRNGIADTAGSVEPPSTRVFGWTAENRLLPMIVAIISIAFALTALAVQAVAEDATGTAAWIGRAVGYLSAGAMFIVFSRTLEPRERRAWRLVGAGLGIYAVGVAGLGAVLAATGSVPATSGFDVLFLCGYILILVGLTRLPHFVGGYNRTRLYLDGAIGAVSLGALIWLVLFDELTTALAGAAAPDVALAVAYPALDVVTLVMVAIVAVRRTTFRIDFRLLILGLAVISQAAANLWYALSATGRSTVEAEPAYLAHMVATLAFVLVATMVGRSPARRAYADQRPHWWSLVAPYGSAGVFVAALSVRLSLADISDTDRGLYFAAATVGVLVVFRQIVAITENRLVVEKERTELVSSISHELRTPLTSVVGYLALLEGNDGELAQSEREEIISVAHRQARYMSDIVTDLVMLSQDDAALLTINRTAVVVHDLADDAARMAGTSDLVRIEIPETLVAHIDETRVRQALVNLLENARRYGGPLHLVRAYSEERDLIIEVHDNGSGVPVRYQLSMWERFERGPNRLNARVPGSGIGLAIVQLIATAHGGLARYVQSTVLGGSCFRVWLPGCVSWDEHAEAALDSGADTEDNTPDLVTPHDAPSPAPLEIEAQHPLGRIR